MTTSTSVTASGYCKYRLPCGYCELKKEQCSWFSYTMPKEWFEPQKNIAVTVYGCPSWEVTCDAERSEE